MPDILKLIVSLLLGAAIGFERESYEKRVDTSPRSGIGSLGVRSYGLISLLGCIAGLSYGFTPLFIFISSAFGLLLLGYYILGSLNTQDVGLTTEVAVLMTFVLGVVMGMGFLPVQVVIALTVVVALILSMKQEIRTFVAGVKEYELDSFISYAIIALVILPFLPNVSYTLGDIPGVKTLLSSVPGLVKIEILNPSSLWRVVVIITGIEVLGYLLEKTIGQKGGWFMTSFAGGFISSTSTTQSLAIRSRKTQEKGLVSAALIANVSSFLQHFLLIATLNSVLLSKSFGYIAGLMLGGIGMLLFFYFRNKGKENARLNETQERLKRDTIFSLKPALQFALLFLAIKFLSKAALVLFGSSAFFVTVVFSALAGIDAITMNIGELAGSVITWQTAVIALMLANAVNLIAKSVYSYLLGSRSFAFRFSLGMAGIIAAGTAGLLLSL